MYKEVLRSIDGIGFLPSLVLLLFFLFFVGVTVWLFYKDKSHWQQIAKIPLDEKKPAQSKSNTEQHTPNI